MFDVIMSTLSSGRVQRRRFDNRSRPESWARRMGTLALRSRIGRRSVRVEVVRIVE